MFPSFYRLLSPLFHAIALLCIKVSLTLNGHFPWKFFGVSVIELQNNDILNITLQGYIVMNCGGKWEMCGRKNKEVVVYAGKDIVR